MKKIILFSTILIIIILSISFIILKMSSSNTNINNTNLNIINNQVDISDSKVTDECINEWSDYAQTVENEITTASTNLVDENTHYIIKNVNGFINIYYLNENDEEILYKKTAISTEYLPAQDLDDLDIGIEVIGAENLNKLLEDYE